MQPITLPNPVTSLNNVLTELGLAVLDYDVTLNGITMDSRRLEAGDLFLALPGVDGDGRDYIPAALASGAAAVLIEDGCTGVTDDWPVPVVRVKRLKERTGELASWFYRYPSRQLRLMGVTGTNGKTSVCWSVAQMLGALDEPCAFMGTLGIGLVDELVAANNTTASSVEINRFLSGLLQRGVSSVVMEVSSHGLVQGRVDQLDFDVGVFTNISRDPLDYHGTLDAYAEAKSRLFRDGAVSKAVVNRDASYSELMISACSPATELLTFSRKLPTADLFLDDVELSPRGANAKIHTPWGEGRIETGQFGLFNLENLLAAVGVLCCQGYPLYSVLECIPRLQSAPGRLQRFGGDGRPLVLIDYAHTPDALDSVLGALRDHGAERLICVFGCGGNRDRGKRPLMMEAAASHADLVIVTSDNPRNEAPRAVIRDVLSGCSGTVEVVEIVDRAEAIHRAIASADTTDVVVVAGKGHEEYQEIRGKKNRFSDADVVNRALGGWQDGVSAP